MMQDGYPFIFQMNDYSDADALLEYTMQYRFKSTKSNHTYIARVEKYLEHSYCIKYFDKANMLSENKFSLRTGTNEARTVYYTLFRILLDVLKRDPKASFFFVGESDDKDLAGEPTRRYRVYKRFVPDLVSEESFAHKRNEELSLYILVNKKAVADIDDYANRLSTAVAKELAL